MEISNAILLSFLGGVLPTIFWLIYWLQEDRKKPEPNFLIFETFIYGALAVPIAFVIQHALNIFVLNGAKIDVIFKTSYFTALFVLIIWASIEEILKYIAAKESGLKSTEYDEPIDAVIYMITAGLGFAAFENMLFILNPILEGELTSAIITGSNRFIGSTLLHTASSAIIGIFIAFSFYKNKKDKIIYLFTGVIISIALHTIFNSFIIRSGYFTTIGFSLVWILLIGLILIFEKIKILKAKN